MAQSMLKTKYIETVKAALMEEFKFKSVMQIPKIEKIVLNMTAGREVTNSKAIEEVMKEMTLIANQKPTTTVAKKSLASWKLREGMPMGAKVTLRGDKMWAFLDKLVNVAIPRIRDFRGLNPKSFDTFGNYSLGIAEEIIFPEIEFDKIRKIKGLDVIIVTSTNDKVAALSMLKGLGLPFAKGGN